MADNCSSALLRCLQQLDDDAIAGVLLPKLVDAGAASNVTLTCKHLRELMQRNVSRLCFRSYSNGRKMEKLISTLPKRFPRCERVLLLYKGDSSYLFGQLLMPALARLPSLSTVGINHHSTLAPVALALQLANMRTQLQQLRCLRIHAIQPLLDSSVVWQQLGSVTQLIRLEVEFRLSIQHTDGEDAGNAFQAKDLAKLGGLTQLQKLKLVAKQVECELHAAPLAVVSKLTSLIDLELSLPVLAGLSKVSRCCSLQRLAVTSSAEQLVQQHAEALAPLTALTSLQMACKLAPAAVLPLYASLRNMRQLQSATLDSWTQEALPVLAELTQLTQVQGRWSSALPGSSSSSLHDSSPHIRKLLGVSGPVPFHAFPSLRVCDYQGSLDPSAVAQLCAHCCSLQELTVKYTDTGYYCWTSLPGNTAAVDRVAAVRSLGQLSALRRLCWHARDDAEVTALAAGARSADALRELTLFAPEEGSEVSPSSLLQLGKLSQLELLILEYDVRDITESEARVLVCGLSDVPHVKVYAPQQQVDCMRSAVAWAQSCGLSVPCTSFRVTGNDDDDDDDGDE